MILENADLLDRREPLVIRVVGVKRVNLVLTGLAFLVLLVKEVSQETRAYLVLPGCLVELEKRGIEVPLVNKEIEVRMVIQDRVVQLDLRVQLVSTVEGVPKDSQVCLVLREKKELVVIQETWAPQFKVVQVNQVMKASVVHQDPQDQRESKAPLVTKDLKDLPEILDPLVSVVTLDQKANAVNPVQKDLPVIGVLLVRKVSLEKEVLMVTRALSDLLVIRDQKDHLDAVFPDLPVKKVNLDR